MTLTLLLGLLASPLAIADVDAQRERGTLTVEIDAGGPLDPASIEAQLEPHRLLLTVPGATLSRARDSFHHHHRYIQAERSKGSVRIEVPFGPTVRCSGAVALEPSATGLIARVSCAAGGSTEPTARIESAAQAAATATARPQPTGPTLPEIAANAPATPTSPPAIHPAPGTAATTAPLATRPAPTAAVTTAPLATKPAPTAAATLAPEASAPGPSALPHDASSSSPSLFLPALLLLALGAAAFFLRRRRAALPRRIQVQETIQLGQKRSLLLVRVGGETLLLGSSETGISLLRTCAAGADAAEPDTSADAAEPHTSAAAAEPDTGAAAAHSLLQRLRGPVAEAGPSFEQAFAGAFQASGEEGDLRLKLQAGLAARVQ